MTIRFFSFIKVYSYFSVPFCFVYAMNNFHLNLLNLPYVELQTWIIGKWTTPREQRWAPPGTHFHQFVVPTIIPFRRDCTYGPLAAMKLPDDVEGLGICEVCISFTILCLLSLQICKDE